MNPVTVSIYVPTFNHENYITQALDSILMQKTQYSYEVFVGEDCSTDDTRQVLQAWEAAHPDERFHFFYRESNMYNSPCTNAQDLKLRCKGKYIICLEGDDFWTDENKLETQVSFLEAHPEYYAVAHNCTVVGADSMPNGEDYPECKDEEYTLRHFASEILPGQYTTLLSKNYMIDPSLDRSLLNIARGVNDRRVYFSLLCHGRIYCIQKKMTAYRHITVGGSSFSATHTYSYDQQEEYQRKYLEYAYHLGHREGIRVAEFLYLRTIRYAHRKGFISSARAKADMARLRHPLQTCCLLFKRDINHRILHRKFHI